MINIAERCLESVVPIPLTGKEIAVMEFELVKYRNYSQNIKTCLIISGLWPNYRPAFLKKILSFISFFTTLFVMLAAANFCFHNAADVMVLTKGTGVAISFSSAFMKAYLFLVHNDDLAYLNDFLTTRYLQDMKVKHNRTDLLKRIGAFHFFMSIHAFSVSLTMFVYAIRPLQVLRKYGKHVRPFPVVYPFSYEPGGFIHWILYLIEASGSFWLWTVTIGVDCVFGLYTLQICGELRVLAKQFRNLRIDEDYAKNLKDCIRRHQVLLNAKVKLEKIFGLITIWLAISGALSLCSLIFQVSEATKSQASLSSTGHYCLYIVPKFVQIFTYAWYGHLIAEESGICSDSIYYSHWPDKCNSCFKNDVMIVLTQQPMVLVAKGIMLIQLDMFTKIVKMSLSYFYLLRTINEPEP